MQALSHQRSAGHTWLQLSGMSLVERESAGASRKRPSALRASYSGIRFASGAAGLDAQPTGAIDTTTCLRARGGFIEQATDFVESQIRSSAVILGRVSRLMQRQLCFADRLAFGAYTEAIFAAAKRVPAENLVNPCA